VKNNASVAAPPPPTLASIFICFLFISLLGIGGGIIAWIWREAVERRRWLDDRRFVGGVALSQIIPGANAVNLSIFVGTSVRGAPGAVSAFAGLIFLPAILVLGLGTLYFTLRQGPIVQAALNGMGAAAIGTSLAVGVRLLRAHAVEWRPVAVILAIVISIGFLRFPLLPVLLIVGPVCLLLFLLPKVLRK